MSVRLPRLLSVFHRATPAEAPAPKAPSGTPDAHGSLFSQARDAFERGGLALLNAGARTLQSAALAVREHTLATTLGRPAPGAGAGKAPVILLAGQSDSANRTMGAFQRSLERDGFRVYVLDDPGHAYESHADAAAQLGALVDRVRAETGAEKVSLVGYSTGGTNARAYASLYGGADKVDRVVQLAGTNNGDPAALDFCESGREEKSGSAFLSALNAAASDVPVYSVFERGTDGEVLEADARLGEAANHFNVPLEQHHAGGGWGPVTDHLGLPFDARAYEAVRGALTGE